jgi:hypothetical protein
LKFAVEYRLANFYASGYTIPGHEIILILFALTRYDISSSVGPYLAILCVAKFQPIGILSELTHNALKNRLLHIFPSS